MADPIPYFDGHNDVLLRLLKSPDTGIADFLSGSNTGHLDLPRARAGNFVGGLFALFSPSPRAPAFTSASNGAFGGPLPAMLPAEQAWGTAMAEVALLFRLIAASEGQLRLCRTAADIRAAVASGTLAVVLHLEGADCIDPDFYLLDVLHAAGLRSLGPVWSRPTIYGNGVPFSFPGSPDIGDGLTEAGKALVRACNRRGIMIDVSHMNEKGFWDVAATTDAPLVATHSNAHSVSASPRNLTARQLDAIAESDGFVGLNFATSYLRDDGAMRADTDIEWMVRHTDALLERLGETRVGIGSDFDGAVIPAAIGSVAGSQALFEALRRHGYDEPLLRRIGMDNWLGVLDRTWGG